MKQLTRVAAVTALLALAVTPGFAKKKSGPKTATCPACKMAMPMEKSDATPVAIKKGKKTFYCCAGCEMGTRGTWKAKKK